MLLSVEADGSLHIFEKGRNTHMRTTAERVAYERTSQKYDTKYEFVRTRPIQYTTYVYLIYFICFNHF